MCIHVYMSKDSYNSLHMTCAHCRLRQSAWTLLPVTHQKNTGHIGHWLFVGQYSLVAYKEYSYIFSIRFLLHVSKYLIISGLPPPPPPSFSRNHSNMDGHVILSGQRFLSFKANHIVKDIVIFKRVYQSVLYRNAT